MRVARGASFTALGVDRLRFFLRAASNISLPLYELLCRHAVGIALADGPNDPAPVLIPPAAIEPVGFAADEALFPWPARSFSGFRLLTEYFAFPEKFLFLDFAGMDAKTLVSGGNRMEIFVYLDRAIPELERAVGNDALALGCTPVVNLFPQRCEPMALTHTATEYRVEPDVRRPGALEVWSVTRCGKPGPTAPSAPGSRSTGSPREHGETDDPAELLPHAATSIASPARRDGCVPRPARPGLRCRRERPMRCCRSMRCAPTATCRRICRSAAAIRC